MNLPSQSLREPPRKRSLRGVPLSKRLELQSIHRRTGCIEWTGYRNAYGYGQMTVGKASKKAHRVAWEVANGQAIPAGRVVMHACDNPACINPAHLSLGSLAENAADRDAKGRHRPLPGEANGNAKLTDEQVLAIRRSSGTLKATAAEYGVHLSLIHLIRKRKAWAHL